MTANNIQDIQDYMLESDNQAKRTKDISEAVVHAAKQNGQVSRNMEQLVDSSKKLVNTIESIAANSEE